LVTLAMLATVSLSQAQQPSADDVNRVGKQLSCPTCTGINVADCPTETCAQWRAKIGELLAEGKTDQEILDYFAARYGDHVLQVPPTRGFFISVWLVPIVGVVVGVVAFLYLAWRWSRREPMPLPSAEDEPVADEYLQRVEKDLGEWKQ
jgi:cytochrome c-type biogenesis protein CcmH